MRVISMVPSLTETLIEAGVNVVGCTRFCVYPRHRVKEIPAVGGTKDLDWDKIKALKPDLLILDQEENLKWMKDQAPCEVMVGHVTSIQAMENFSRDLIQLDPQNLLLKDFAVRWKRVEESPAKVWSWQDLPGTLETWLEEPDEEPTEAVYVIWKNPWMKAGSDTFIQSVMEKLGAGKLRPQTLSRYPQFDESEFKDDKKVFLFSSEPYPFGPAKESLKKLTPWRGVIVQGEYYSWFGLRSLEFLERELGLRKE